MSFQEGRIYKHERNIDVAFWVTSVRQEDLITLKGWWINISFQNPKAITQDTIKVDMDQVHSWQLRKDLEEKMGLHG